VAAAYIVNLPEQAPSDSLHTRSTKILPGGKLSEVMIVVLKKVTPKGQPGQLTYTDGKLTSRSDPT
jgi:hypothetical protein